jgi:hypothetical protein
LNISIKILGFKSWDLNPLRAWDQEHGIKKHIDWCVKSVTNIIQCSFIMPFTLDNQTILYIIIALFVVQFLVMRYYVQSTIEASNQKNNKKIVKNLTHQIKSTFDQYMGNGAWNSRNDRHGTQEFDSLAGVPGTKGPGTGAPRAKGPGTGAPGAKGPGTGAPRAKGPDARQGKDQDNTYVQDRIYEKNRRRKRIADQDSIEDPADDPGNDLEKDQDDAIDLTNHDDNEES